MGLALVAGILLFSRLAHAAQITLTTSHPPASPLSMTQNTTSATMFIRASADTAPGSPGPADRMLAWQFRVQIVPDAGAVGTLTFNNPTSATPASPPGYVFASSAGISATKTSGNTVLDANDFDNAAAGSVVPVAGANLLAVDFTASAAALGTWGIFAVPGASTTVWTDGVPSTRTYANVPVAGSPVQIGSVSVVPEPAGIAVLAMAAGGTTLRRRRVSLGRA